MKSSLLIALFLAAAALAATEGATCTTRTAISSATVAEEQSVQTPASTAYPTPTPAPSPTRTAVQALSPGSAPTPTPSLSSLEKVINDRISSGNGINVSLPKVYDDTLLQQMLEGAEARLASMQVLNQAGVSGAIGSVSGATQQISSFGLNLQGIMPQIATTTNGPTSSTSVTSAIPGQTNPIQGGTTTVTTNTLPNQSVVTTVVPPAPATAPAPSTSLPSTYSVSASSVLNEQMQLTSEIAGLRLLLEGSLTDRYVTTNYGTFVRPKTTLGFNITLDPGKQYKDAVAVVEVVVSSPPGVSGDDIRPAITALLPREKTYNVAAINDRSTSIGAGVVTQVFGVSGSWLGGRKTYYLVKDQDTLAMPFKVDDPAQVGFDWEFKPVLGRSYVDTQSRDNFVQVAFPTFPDTTEFGTVTVSTYWRRYDRDKGVTKEVIPNSLRVVCTCAPIKKPSLLSNSRVFNVANVQDLGGGQMLVNLGESFLKGTYVRIGSSVITQGPNLSLEDKRMRFIAPISDLATKRVFLVARDGAEIPLEIGSSALPCNQGLKVKDVDIKTADAANSLVKIKINDSCFIESFNGTTRVEVPPLLIVVGGKVFGHKDAPIQRDAKSNTLAALIPTSLLMANPEIIVETLFHNDRYRDTYDVHDKFQQQGGLTDYMLGQSERLVLIGQREANAKPQDIEADDPPPTQAGSASPKRTKPTLTKAKTTKPGPAAVKKTAGSSASARASKSQSNYEFLLYGNRLDHVKVLAPDGVNLTPIGGRTEDGATLARLELSPGQVKTQKYLVLQRCDDRPFLVQIPDITPSAPGGSPDLKPAERLTVGADQIVVNGDIKDLTKVTFNGKQIALEKDGDGKSVTLKGLSAGGVTATATIKTLIFWFGDKKVEVKIEVVTAKVETVGK